MRATAHQPSAPRYSTFEADREQRLTPGSLLLDGRLNVVAEVACGGTSVVYRAIDHADGDRHVALKVVNAAARPAAAAARFRNETRLMKSWTGHPHVVPATATGRLDGPWGFEGRPYLLTHFIEGVALDRVMGDHRRGLEWGRACTIARDVARALVDLYDQGIVHRDIKPGNVLLARGITERAMLVDFGMALEIGDGWEVRTPHLTREGASGTLLYMSPQQIAQEPPAPSMDVYSFGIMLYELLSGNPPHHKLTAAEILTRRCDARRPPFPLAKLYPGLDRATTDLVERCLHYEPVRRPSARELLATLDELLARRASSGPQLAPGVAPTLQPAPVELPAAAAPIAAPRVSEPPRHERRRSITTAVGGVLAIAVVGALARSFELAEPATQTVASARSDAQHFEAPVDPRPLVMPLVVDPPREPTSPAPAVPPSASAPGPVETPALAPSKPRSKHRSEDCAAAVSNARVGAENRDWARVLRSTKSDACWRSHASAERIRLRTQALFETFRYEECAAVGGRATAPDVLRWAHICAGKTRGQSP